MVETVWTDADLARDPHAAADKARRVERMFAAIASSYDLNNRLHSLWRDQAWRRAAVKMAELKPTDRVLDVACGTGDLTLAFGDALRDLNRPDTFKVGQVHGVDFTEPMLRIARTKSRDHVWPSEFMRPDAFVNPARFSQAVLFTRGDAMALPVADASVDVVSIAFGIRNVARPEVALREFHRVLRPGGRVIVLEFSKPTNALLRWLNDVYCGRIMPITATLIARDRSGAYRYLPKSVDTFQPRETMMAAMGDAGFADVTCRPLTFGIAVIYRGLKG